MSSELGSLDDGAWRGQRCVPRDDVIVTDLGDQLVLLDPSNQEMYALEGAGRFVWQTLPSASLGVVAAAMAAHYRLEQGTADGDLHALVTEFVAAGLVRVLPQADVADA